MLNHPVITRRFEIDTGHRLPQHEGKCRNYHGHRYVFELTVGSHSFDVVQGMAVDFGLVKKAVGDWLDENWDHGMILQQGDPAIEFMQAAGSKVYVMRDPPTVENIAVEFARYARTALHNADLAHVLIYKVCVFETPNCWTDYFPPETRS